MNKQEIIKRLTDLLATISGYYFKGRLEGCRPWVHERDEECAAISIDLYNFGGDGEPVCDGLKPCTITYDDGSQDSGHLFCMCYDPDDVTPLVFLFSPEDDSDDIEIDPEDLPEDVLQNILTWLEAEWESNAKQEDKPDVKQLTAMNEQEIIMLGVAIDSHVKMLINEEEAYKRNGNTEAVRECLDEVRRFKALKEKLENGYGQ